MLTILEALINLEERALSAGKKRFQKDDGRPDGKKLNEAQLAAHGLAYLATEVAACRALTEWSSGLEGSGHASAPIAQKITSAYLGDLATRLFGGVDLGPCESVSLHELGLSDADIEDTLGRVKADAAAASAAESYIEIARLSDEAGYGDPGFDADDDGELLREIRTQFAKFVDQSVLPIAQEVHQKDILIPQAIVDSLAELGVFGLTIPENYGGLGMSKVAMCVVTEELSRGYIGVGSLGTRAEIAAELILGGGTEAQKERWLPKIAAGQVLPTAVFTEPNTGSDLAHLGTRAEKIDAASAESGYRVFGQKTWITHAVRADLMTLLARTNKEEPGYRGLSMFLAEKTRLDPAPGEREFVDEGLDGTEIPVLGYRGMKEYELSFEGYELPKEALLGGEEGAGFKQLMRTFESARIQTAARGVGVAKAALDEAMRYSKERVQFGKAIFEFPRVARKLGRMIASIQACRQLTFFAARQKDQDKRCDLEAGMAKLLATRCAWECADAGVQIHGGNGYAIEYTASRLLVDARVLSIFEGANEIQAHVVARRLVEA